MLCEHREQERPRAVGFPRSRLWGTTAIVSHERRICDDSNFCRQLFFLLCSFRVKLELASACSPSRGEPRHLSLGNGVLCDLLAWHEKRAEVEWVCASAWPSAARARKQRQFVCGMRFAIRFRLGRANWPYETRNYQVAMEANLLAVERGQRIMFVEEEELGVVRVMPNRPSCSLHPHHVRLPGEVCQERATVQPIVMSRARRPKLIGGLFQGQ